MSLQVVVILTLACAGACGFDTSGLGTPAVTDGAATPSADAPALSAPDDAATSADAPPDDAATSADARVTASPDATRVVDARSPDAAPCGYLGEACCAPDDQCALGLCLNAVCVGL